MKKIEAFSAQELPKRIQYTPEGKLRKQAIDLSKCELMQLWQYNCEVEDRRDNNASVKCYPIMRVFRKCANGVTVETTAWDEEVI